MNYQPVVVVFVFESPVAPVSFVILQVYQQQLLLSLVVPLQLLFVVLHSLLLLKVVELVALFVQAVYIVLLLLLVLLVN